jgi:putative ATP-dependent endonuclease of the OLD family
MYLSELKIWNFRKYGIKKVEDKTEKPELVLVFNKGLNLIVGENDSGKTSILDAIKLIVLTQSKEYIRPDYEDFHLPNGKTDEKDRATVFRIECIFRGFEDIEAKNFLEWLGIEKDDKGNPSYFLRIFLVAKRKGKNVFHDVKAGVDEEGSDLNSEARDLLRATYLKPLRDAEVELMPGRRSRLAQILISHELFDSQGTDHALVSIFKDANEQIKNYFKGLKSDGTTIDDKSGKDILDDINSYLNEFFTTDENKQANFSITDPELKNILEKLELKFIETKVGLGSLNRLFIASELLLLKRGAYTGLRLALIEEIEAHLHPQAQLRLIEYLQDEVAGKSGVQLIISSHSPNLASKVKLNNLIICKCDDAYPMGDSFTLLEKGDYGFLERFLDTTKSNLFFAKGVILVEGDAENLILPTIAKIIGRDLSKHGVSIVNIGSTAFLRYARIFKRGKDEKGLGVPVSCITDSDIRPAEYKAIDSSAKTINEYTKTELEEHRRSKTQDLDGQGVQAFVSPNWTLEYDICLGGFYKEFYQAVLCAEKIKNSNKIGLTEEKIREIDGKVSADCVAWESDRSTAPQIAFDIYYNTMIKKNISKAIVAQCFATVLDSIVDKESLKNRILADEQFKYLIDAINHATGI